LSEIFKTEAIVLRSSRWSESSKIVHLFSKDKGYLRVIAKGAFQEKSSFRGTLETLNFVEIVVSHKETRGLQLITSASLQNSFQKIREDLQRTAIAFSVIELIQQFLSTHEPIPEFFLYTIDLLDALNEDKFSNHKIFLWHFLIRLSDILGFGWSLDQCLNCNTSLQTTTLFLDYENGGIICQNCKPKVQINGIQINHQQYQFLKAVAETDVNEIHHFFDEFHEKPATDFTNLLLKHLSFHTDMLIELKSLKWYG
jgi:DNA repair protein RecO (recombination protein O)